MTENHNQTDNFNESLEANENKAFVDENKPDSSSEIEDLTHDEAPSQTEDFSEDLSNTDQNQNNIPELPNLPFPNILEQEIQSTEIPLDPVAENESLIFQNEGSKELKDLKLFPSFLTKYESYLSYLKGLKSEVLIPVFIILSGVIVASFALNSLKNIQKGDLNPINVQESNSPPTSNPIIENQNLQVQIFWLENNQNTIKLFPQSITIDQSASPQDILRSAFERLLVGSNNSQYSSAIPKGTKLLDLRVLGDNVYIDLSKEFTSGGGSQSMMGRLAQVLYTATSLNQNAQIYFKVEGEDLTVLGGEGLMIDQPLTRSQFEENFPL